MLCLGRCYEGKKAEDGCNKVFHSVGNFLFYVHFRRKDIKNFLKRSVISEIGVISVISAIKITITPISPITPILMLIPSNYITRGISRPAKHEKPQFTMR